MYCVYLTSYSGVKLPPKYVGSTSIKKFNTGYHGSVRSKKYKTIWKEELKNNPTLFSSSILSTHATREEALTAELNFQIENNVVKNEDYINLAFASQNGFFGKDVSGVNNPMFGKKHSEKSKTLMSKNCPDRFGDKNPMFGKKSDSWKYKKHHSNEAKAKMSEAKKGIFVGDKNPMFGKPSAMRGKTQSEKAKAKMKGPKPIISCPHCGKSGGKPAMIRFHFDNCKLRTNT